MYTFLLIVFIITVILLIPTILLQSGSGAQSGMFGSDITLGAFGAKTSEVLVNFTKWLVGIFLVTAFLLGYIKVQQNKAYLRQPQNAPAETQGTGTGMDTNAAGPSAATNP